MWKFSDQNAFHNKSKCGSCVKVLWSCELEQTFIWHQDFTIKLKNAIKNKQKTNKQTFKHTLLTHPFSWHHWIVNCSVRFATHVAAWVYDQSSCTPRSAPYHFCVIFNHWRLLATVLLAGAFTCFVVIVVVVPVVMWSAPSPSQTRRSRNRLCCYWSYTESTGKVCLSLNVKGIHFNA